MSLFLANILLAIVWAMMNEEVSLANLVVGFILGYIVLAMTATVTGGSGYVRRVQQLVAFLLWFTKELLMANVRVAYEVARPRHRFQPGNVAIPLEANTPTEITLLANLITLTPGTLSLDLSDDRKTLYIHAMFVSDPEETRREIKDGLEKRLLEVLR
jgi:multicomponent Na+:H+ antiporter subunit E